MLLLMEQVVELISEACEQGVRNYGQHSSIRPCRHGCYLWRRFIRRFECFLICQSEYTQVDCLHKNEFVFVKRFNRECFRGYICGIEQTMINLRECFFVFAERPAFK